MKTVIIAAAAAALVVGPAKAGHYRNTEAGHYRDAEAGHYRNTEVGHYRNAEAGQYQRPVDTRHEITYAQDAHASFTVGTATAQRGQRAYGVLKVPAGSDAGYDIPVAVVHGEAWPGARDCLGRARH